MAAPRPAGPDDLRTAVAIAVVKARRQREAEAQRWRVRAQELEQELASLRSLANPLVELLRQQVHGGAPAAPPHPQPSRKSKAKAGACSHVAAGPSGLEALLQGMLQQAGIAEQEPVASLAVGLADHEQQQRLQASCQLPPTSQQQLEQRAQGLQHLLMGIKALQFALGAHGFTPLSACASASTAVPSQQEVPQPGAAATTSRQGPDTLNAPGALRGQVQAVLSFMVNTLTTLAPSELRKTYMRYSVDLLATLLSPTDAGGASSYGSSSLHDKGLSGRGGAAASQEVAHALQLAGPSLLASLAMLDCAGAASGASVPVASAAGAAATAAAKHRRPCNGSRQQGLGSVGVLVLDAVGLLLDRSMPCSPNPSTHDLHGPHISQGSAWACDPSVPTSSPSPALVSRPDAAQALLQHMVAASPLLGQLVMVACAAALHRSTAQLVQALSPAAQAGQAREANGSGMAASRSMLLAGAATEFEAAHFRFSLLDACLAKLPAWCRAGSVAAASSHHSISVAPRFRQSSAGALDSQDAATPAASAPQPSADLSCSCSCLGLITTVLMSCFALLPPLHGKLPLFCSACVRSTATLAAALQHVAVAPEYAGNAALREECMELCKRVRAAFAVPP